MALRDQPYLPLYVQDFLTDEKLSECSASTTGVYIRLMCLMHKSEEYGKILLRQKHKQNTEQIKNFAAVIAKNMPYDSATIERALQELIDEKVLILDGDQLIQKRMVHDCEISKIRAAAGKKGGNHPHKTADQPKDFAQPKPKAKPLAKEEANSEYENATENENRTVIKNEKKKRKEKVSVNIVKPREIVFEDSVIGTQDEFVKAFTGSDYGDFNLIYYFKVIHEWFMNPDLPPPKRTDNGWKLSAQKWMRKDLVNGKAVHANQKFEPRKNGTNKNFDRTTGTEEQERLKSAYRQLTSPIRE